MRSWKLTASLFVTILVAMPLVTLAASDDESDESFENEVRAKIEREKLDRLRGWRRIVFFCSPPGKPKELFERVCERTNTNVKFLAASGNVQVSVATNAGSLGFLSTYRGMLRLEVDLHSTDCNGSVCALHATVSASFPYDRAIDQAARSYPIDEKDRSGPKDSPAAVPRPVLALMWGPRHLTASGYAGEELAAGVANAIDSLLKEFFTDYLNANRK